MTDETPKQRSKRKQREASLRYYHANRDRLLEANKAYREANRDALTAREKARRAEKVAALRAEDPEWDAKRLERRRALRAAKAEERRSKNAEWRDANRDHVNSRAKLAYMKRKYGLTPQQYRDLMASNGGRCWICGMTESTGRSTELGVDHCHSTGKVRGVLCFACNTSIGKLGDTVEGLRRALAYLEAFEDPIQGGQNSMTVSDPC